MVSNNKEKKLSNEYNEYIKSETFQKLRSHRLKIDGYKCQRCGKPFDLQVHHIHYPSVLGTEDPYTDLITLCSRCHIFIEQNKDKYREEEIKKQEEASKKNEEFRRMVEEQRAQIEANQREYERAKALVSEFIKNVKQNDLSRKGPGGIDYCNIDIIKADLFPFLRSNNARLMGVSTVQNYFRNRRYEIILKMLEDGKDKQEIQKETGFTCNMINKAIKNPYFVKSILKNEKENYEYD